VIRDGEAGRPGACSHKVTFTLDDTLALKGLKRYNKIKLITNMIELRNLHCKCLLLLLHLLHFEGHHVMHELSDERVTLSYPPAFLTHLETMGRGREIYLVGIGF